MPEIAPFRAVRYAARDSETLGRCIAPPYDVISSAERKALAARGARNVVHLILPEELQGDDAENNRYRRAGLAYRQWISDGSLTRDAAPAIYVLHQDFEWEGQRYRRRGFLARLKLQPFSDGVVLPHERTLSGPKTDRLNLFRAVKANLSPIFALVDDRGDLQNALEPAGDPEVAVRGDDGVDNLMWPVRDPAVLAAVVERVGPRKAYIADGHHRYETGLAYAKEIDREGRIEGAHHSILAYFCGLSDSGLLVLPTHRLLHSIPGFDAGALIREALPFFSVEKVSLGDLDQARARLVEAGRDRPAFLMVVEHEGWCFSLKADVDLASVQELPRHPAVRSLDVSVLHGLIFGRLLHLSQPSQDRQENLRYVKDSRQAVAAVERGEAQAAFLLNGTRLEQVRQVAEAGEVMPQKSTYFHPKLPSGLLFNPLDPSEPL